MDETTAISAAGAAMVVGKPIADKLADFSEQLLGPIAKEIGCGLGEVGKRFKIKNQFATYELVKSIAVERGIDITSVDPSFGVEWLESVATVTNSSLQEIWAKLMASAMQGDSAGHLRYLHALKQMAPDDARLIAHCVNYPHSIKRPSEDLAIEVDESTANLYRLGILVPQHYVCGRENENEKFSVKGSITSDDLRLCVSQFGKLFAEAVGIRVTVDQS